MRSWMTWGVMPKADEPLAVPALLRAGETPAVPGAVDPPFGLNKLVGLNDGPKCGCGKRSSTLAALPKYSRHSGETEEASRRNFSYKSSTNARFAGFSVKSVAVIKWLFWFHLKRRDNPLSAICVKSLLYGFADEIRVGD